MIVFFTSAGVKENRTILLCKKSGGDAEIGEVEDQDDARSWKRPSALLSLKVRGEKRERAVERTHPQTRRAGAPVKTIFHSVPSGLSARLLLRGARRRKIL
jgi:hypothetical protein